MRSTARSRCAGWPGPSTRPRVVGSCHAARRRPLPSYVAPARRERGRPGWLSAPRVRPRPRRSRPSSSAAPPDSSRVVGHDPSGADWGRIVEAVAHEPARDRRPRGGAVCWPCSPPRWSRRCRSRRTAPARPSTSSAGRRRGDHPGRRAPDLPRRRADPDDHGLGLAPGVDKPVRRDEDWIDPDNAVYPYDVVHPRDRPPSRAGRGPGPDGVLAGQRDRRRAAGAGLRRHPGARGRRRRARAPADGALAVRDIFVSVDGTAVTRPRSCSTRSASRRAEAPSRGPPRRQGGHRRGGPGGRGRRRPRSASPPASASSSRSRSRSTSTPTSAARAPA